jgi:Yip1-like protein
MKIVERVKNVLLQPKTEWAAIEPEQTDLKTLYTRYIAIVAVIPAAVSLVAMAAFVGPFGVRVGLGAALASAVVQYVLSLVMVFVLAFIADTLAPSFDGRRNLNQALKLTAYAMTAVWVAGVFVIVPGIGWLLSFIGIVYSLYLFFLGTPLLMKVPEQKAIGYTVVVVMAAIIVSIAIGMISASILRVGPAGMIGGIPRF